MSSRQCGVVLLPVDNLDSRGLHISADYEMVYRYRVSNIDVFEVPGLSFLTLEIKPGSVAMTRPDFSHQCELMVTNGTLIIADFSPGFKTLVPGTQPETDLPWQPPATFWTYLKKDRLAGVVSIDGHPAQGPRRALGFGSAGDSQISIAPSSQDVAIVAVEFTIQVSSAHGILDYNGRRYPIPGYTFRVALRPNEIHHGKHSFNIESPSKARVIEVTPWVIPWAELSIGEGVLDAPQDFDWLASGQSLLDFRLSAKPCGQMEELVSQLACASQGFDVHEHRAVFADVVKEIYRNARFSEYFREIVVKCAALEPDYVFGVWGEVLEQLLTETGKDASLLSAQIWRDISLLPEQQRCTASRVAWANLPPTGIQALAAAFTT
jgi:hypothetical protein